MTTKSKRTTKPVQAKPSRQSIITKQLAHILNMRSQAIEMFKEAEALESALLDHIAVDTPYQLPDGRTVTLVDNFASKNTVFKAGRFSRFELKVIGK